MDFIQRQEGPCLSPSEVLTESTVGNIILEAKREQGGGGRGAGYKAVQRMVRPLDKGKFLAGAQIGFSTLPSSVTF